MEKKYVDSRELAEIMCVSTQTIDRMVKNRDIPFLEFGSGEQRSIKRFCVADVVEAVKPDDTDGYENY